MKTKVKILKAQIYEAEMNFEYPNKIILTMHMIADTNYATENSRKCGMKIMELKDIHKKIGITIEELK